MAGRTLIIIGLIGILDFIFLLLVGGGINFGTLFPAGAGILLIAWGYFKLKIQYPVHERSSWYSMFKRLEKIVTLFIMIWLASFIWIVTLIFMSAHPTNKVDADYMIVLGSGLHDDQLTLTLLERLNTSIDYLSKYPDLPVVVTGGKGFGETISEAEAMKKYLVEQGINKERILTEDQSTSTMENFRFSKDLLLKKGEKEPLKILIVTSDFHLFRAKLLARRIGFEPTGLPAKTPIYVLPNLYIREYFAVVKSFLFDR
ncbi:YdcF family protein [Tepidibacillus infernus]|uniref:YdcF family protein n=1 Tax=Tepidibacillus TaxID=1494427 RepID=UPI000853A4D9|nr:YdcF family protein [Tepidibacillus sp. HK-1]GBF12106.1 hypothetical protein HK1_02167 [Tepidibacillus sp. HK-1]